jgi:hypothetical protein
LATCRCHRLRSPIGSYQRSLRTQRACRSARIEELTQRLRCDSSQIERILSRHRFSLALGSRSQPLVSGFFLISGSLMLYCSMVIGWHLVV